MGASNIDSAPTYTIHRTLKDAMSVMGRSYAVQDASGAATLTVSQEMHLGSDKWSVRDAQGSEVATITRGPLHVHPTFDFVGSDGTSVTITKANFSPLHETWRIEGLTSGTIDIHGSITNHEFELVHADGNVVARASRKWASITEGYGLQVTAGLPLVVAVAAAVALDETENTH